ncbi:MAG TPA: hypothetical protein VI895_05515, partial [Bdellovibrionota bacterium]|nr:hypothetical protein [Bdellovibrionota bacterium]
DLFADCDPEEARRKARLRVLIGGISGYWQVSPTVWTQSETSSIPVASLGQTESSLLDTGHPILTEPVSSSKSPHTVVQSAFG